MISRSLKIGLVGIVILTVALAQGPPVEPGPFRQPDLVELTKLDPTIKLDIRYAWAGERTDCAGAAFAGAASDSTDS